MSDQTWAQVNDTMITVGQAAAQWRQLAEDMERQRNEALADAVQARQRVSMLEAALETQQRWVHGRFHTDGIGEPRQQDCLHSDCVQIRALIAAPTSPAAAGAGTHRKQ